MKEKDIYYSAIEANIANKNRIYRKAVNSRQRPGLKRGLAVAAACFVVMASVVACVPEARATTDAMTTKQAAATARPRLRPGL